MKLYDADTNEEVFVDNIGGANTTYISYTDRKTTIELSHRPEVQFRHHSILITGFHLVVDEEDEPIRWELVTVELCTRKKPKSRCKDNKLGKKLLKVIAIKEIKRSKK